MMIDRGPWLKRLVAPLLAATCLVAVACGDDEGVGSANEGGANSLAGASGEGGGCAAEGCGGAGADAAQGGMTDVGGAGECAATSCVAEGKSCGSIPDGCGNTLDCGTCDDGSECGVVIDNVCGCPPDQDALSSAPRTARRARSSGFSGNAQAYAELHELACTGLEQCIEGCLERGGSGAMCDASACLEGSAGESDCLPAPVWSNLQNIQFAKETVDEAVQLTVVFTPYHDQLLTDRYGVEVPETAEIRGITVEIRKAGSEIVDDSVKLLKAGQALGGERAASEPWPEELTWASYGGPTDLWGLEWTPADVVSDDFGVALSVLYTKTVGNTRAYIDQIRVTVHYAVTCEP